MAADTSVKFEHNGVRFAAGRIPAMQQFHIVRRLAPVLAQMLSVFSAVTLGESLKATAATESGDPEAMAKAGAATLANEQAIAGVEGVAKALAGLSDADAEYVLHGLLKSVEREHMGAWGQVSNGTMFMFGDLPLPALLFLAFKALQTNLADFFAAIPSDLKAAALKANAR